MVLSAVIYTDLVRSISPHLPTMVNEEGREEQGCLRLHDPYGARPSGSGRSPFSCTVSVRLTVIEVVKVVE